jgi:glycosyltransferase involved in cell wall biosynthesis
MDYTVIIPAHNCNKELRILLEDIHATCHKYKPKEIFIVDDGSTDKEAQYLANIYTSSQIPIKYLEYGKQLGPFYAEQHGLDNVTTPYAIVLHSDVALKSSHNLPIRYDDTLSVLACYLHKTNDAVAVSAMLLNIQDSNYIVRGTRSLGRDYLPYSHQKEFYFPSLLNVKWDRWRRVLSCDGCMYAIRMDYYHKIRFDELFAPYLYYHDDFFARCRSSGYHLYFTYDIAAYHPLYSAKPEGSLAVVTNEMYREKSNTFLTRWGKNAEAWSERSLGKNVQIIEEIEVG